MPKYGTVSQVLLQLVVALPWSQGLDKFKLFEPIKLICVFVKILTNQRRQGSDSDPLVCLKVIFKSEVTKGFALPRRVKRLFSRTRRKFQEKHLGPGCANSQMLANRDSFDSQLPKTTQTHFATLQVLISSPSLGKRVG